MRIPSPRAARSPRSDAGSRAAWLRIFGAALLAALAGEAGAIGLGAISQQSAFGAALRVVVPVILGPGEELSGECVRLASGQRADDGIPQVREARITLERTGAGARIVVYSPRTVVDPVLRLTVQAGCDSVVRREYTLLMDPVPIEEPVATVATMPAATAPVVAVPAPAAAGRMPAGAAGGAAASPGRTPGTTGRVTPRQRAAARSAGGTREQPATASRPRASATRTAPKPATATAARPRLTVSSAEPQVGAPGAGAGAAQPPADASAAALEAQAAALQQRVVELTAMIDKMKEEMRAAEALQAAQAARISASEAAKTNPPAMLSRLWSEGWPLLVAFVALAALIAAFLSLRRRRLAAAASPWRMDAPAQGGGLRPAAAYPGRSVPSGQSVSTPAAPVPAAAANAAAAALRPAGAATTAEPSIVDVSELSHVTEEAGVYLAFNRPDRAIEVLEDHVRSVPHSLPAAWLMLLDLYHKQGREPDFRNLAEQFHAKFNAQTPGWEGYGRNVEGDRGLEAFPHLTRQLAIVWRKPECREFLDHLLHENRDGRRSGFSLAAYEDILFLRQLAESLSAADAAGRPAPRPAAARPSAPAGSGAAPQVPGRPPTLDLELALDEDMLATNKPGGGGASAPSDKDPRSKT